MRHINVDLTPDERDLLVRILEDALGEDRTKLHRSRISSKLRAQLEVEDAELRQILEKLMEAHPELGV
jgi:hypothetical protein